MSENFRLGTLGPADPLPIRPRRVLVAGASGSGKTTLAATIAAALGVPHTEIDGLFHGPGWIPQATFVTDVESMAAGPDWVTEWQYRAVRAHLAGRAELLVWLDLPRSLVLRRVVRRTLRRRIGRIPLWNDTLEPPLTTFFTDRDHIVRWSWRTHPGIAPKVLDAARENPQLLVVRLGTPRAVREWITGPLARAGRSS